MLTKNYYKFTDLPSMKKHLAQVDYYYHAAKQLELDKKEQAATEEREHQMKLYKKQVAKTERALIHQHNERRARLDNQYRRH